MTAVRVLGIFALLLVLTCILSACGGGGGSAPAAGPVTVSGVVSKGIIANGTVAVYGLKADGSKTASALATAKTDANGAYAVSLGSYAGPIIVEAYGSYTDEATGTTVRIPSTSPLQAALPSSRVAGNVSLPVTPLTDIAVRMARNALTGTVADNIASANDAVSRLFGVDVVATLPVKPDAAVLQSADTTDSQRKYTALLAVVSQYVANTSATQGKPGSDDLTSALARISGGITPNDTAVPQVEASVASGLQSAAVALSKNESQVAKAIMGSGSAITDCIASVQAIGSNSGGRIVAYTLNTAVTSSYTGQIFAAYAKIEVPTGINLPGGELPPSTLAVSGVAAASSQVKVLIGNVVADTTTTPNKQVLYVEFADTSGISLGEFATIYVEMPAGTTPPPAEAFTVASSSACTADGIAIGGVSVAVALSAL